MHEIASFLHGFKRFQKNAFCHSRDLYESLLQGQRPKALVVACSDSRVDPAILTDSCPGELFVVRNIGGLVPPFEPDSGRHGVSAAVEYAVLVLKVEHIIVMGHSHCGGIEALMTEPDPAADAETGYSFVRPWVDIASAAREQVLRELSGAPFDKKCRACEQASVLVSLENLLTFPFVYRRAAGGSLTLHGWWFNMQSGELLSYLPETGAFEPLVGRCPV